MDRLLRRRGEVRRQEDQQRAVPVHLVASNGQIVATSEAYTRKQSALDTIESIKKNVAAASIDDETDRERPSMTSVQPASEG